MSISLKQYETLCKKKNRNCSEKQVLLKSKVINFKDGNASILGIDPSLRGTGYGVISIHGKEINALACGTIECPKEWRRSQCILKIAQELRRVVVSYKPDLCVMEGLFYAQNRQTALIMGEARGASILVVADFGVKIFEIAPRRVKQAITGYGGASKTSVAKMVQRILNLKEQPEPDAADALAVAIAFAQEYSTLLTDAIKQI